MVCDGVPPHSEMDMKLSVLSQLNRVGTLTVLISVCVCACVWVCVHVCVGACACVCVCVCVHVHACVFVPTTCSYSIQTSFPAHREAA